MHDIHFHTSLSACAKERSDFTDYIAAIPDNKLECAGFSDHLWDKAVPGDHALDSGTNTPECFMGSGNTTSGDQQIGNISGNQTAVWYFEKPPWRV